MASLLNRRYLISFRSPITNRPAEAPRPARPHRCCSVARRWPGARRRGLSCPRLAVGRILAPASALPPSASPRCAGRHAVAGALWGASLRVSAGLPGWRVGVCRGFVLGFGFACAGGVPWFAGVAALGAVVASARRVRPGRWRVSVAAAGVLAGILRCRGRGGLFLACRRVGLRGGVVWLGRLSAGRSAVRRPLRACVRRLRAGGRAAVCPAVAASGAARSGRVGAGRLGGWGLLSVFRDGVAAAAGRRGALARHRHPGRH